MSNSHTGLIAPHGGLTAPVNRTVADVEAFLTEAREWARVLVSDADLSSVYRFGDGGLSPLTGPMDAQTYHRVLDEAVIEVDGSRYAWTIPISLPVRAEVAKTLSVGNASRWKTRRARSWARWTSATFLNGTNPRTSSAFI